MTFRDKKARKWSEKWNIKNLSNGTSGKFLIGKGEKNLNFRFSREGDVGWRFELKDDSSCMKFRNWLRKHPEQVVRGLELIETWQDQWQKAQSRSNIDDDKTVLRFKIDHMGDEKAVALFSSEFVKMVFQNEEDHIAPIDKGSFKSDVGDYSSDLAKALRQAIESHVQN